MDYKPSDVFIGFVDFFAILLPGALLTFFLVQLIESRLIAIFPVLQNSTAAWAAFVFASYFLGHFVSMLDSPLDQVYKHTFRRYQGSYTDYLMNRAQSIVQAPLDPHCADDNDLVLHLATAMVRLRSPSGAVEIDRLKADAKFFRNNTVVLVVASFIFLVKAEWLFGMGCVGLTVLSILRFMSRRKSEEELTYELLIASARLKETDADFRDA